MKLGINALYLIPGRVGGSEIYLRELLAGLSRVDSQNEYLVYVNRESRGSLELGDNFREVPLQVPARNRPLRLAWEQMVLPRCARRDKIELLHSPGSSAPLWLDCASVVTILDLIYLRFPETFPLGTRGMIRWLTSLAAARADGVIALSEFSRNEIMWELDVPWNRIHAVYLGGGSVSPSMLPRSERIRILRSMGIMGPFILTVSAAHPHKNLYRLIEGYYRWRRQGGRYQLVIAGVRHDRHYRKLLEVVGRMNLTGEVIFTGWIPEEYKRVLFAEAGMFIYPSLLEGFGLPILEAMISGIPVACSSVSSLDEVAGSAAYRFDPYSSRQIAQAIEVCLRDQDLIQRLIRAGHDQHQKFSWTATAAQTLEIYRKTLKL